MSRLRNIPQSGEEQVANALTNIGRQVRSLRSQQQRAPQSAYFYDATEYTVAAGGGTKTWATVSLTVPERGGLLLISWRALAKGAAAGQWIPRLTCDVDWPGYSSSGISTEIDLQTTVRTLSTVYIQHSSGEPGDVLGVVSAAVTPGTRTFAFKAVNGSGFTQNVKEVKLWVAAI